MRTELAALDSSVIIAVVGAGSMGAGIAQVAAAAGHRTLLFDHNPDVVTQALARIANGLTQQVQRSRMTPAARSALLARITAVSALEQLAGAGLVVEAVVETLSVKRDLFSRLERICAGDTLLASNTSSLSISAIAAGLSRPGNLAGMHFFNPAPVMQLVEVVSGITTDRRVAQTLFDTARAWHKRPVHTRSTPGFIVNRVARPFYGEALRLLEEGAADHATIDALLREAGGFRMGPFELTDLIGQDVNYAVTCSVFDAFHQDKRYLPSSIQRELVEGGLLGRKSGRGFYDYSSSAVAPLPTVAGQQRAPTQIEVHGPLGVAEPLLPLWQRAGIQITRGGGDAGVIRAGTALIALSDGRSASQRAAESGCADTLLFDLALDYATTTRIALTAADQASSAALESATGLFQAAGKAVSLIDDTPGLLVLRTVCMLANEGADTVLQQVCDAAAVDTAMCAGVNYPLGPLAWADRLTPALVLRVLSNLQQAYGSERYRPSLLLRRKALTGALFHETGRPSVANQQPPDETAP